ncbi:peptide-methionine (S)-S-oxide reductase MsrA [Phreatobacter stygius]|uniref:Peptide methionine sulfoxide reductase MsrA n=1 Tax=Phreatobacter stygius TaxID=1940610 RepID=A0A4D7AZD2_9HYPH|nr:peptide-methionine (S)-S-oxide reductase MsrA [Phreatobacter stygius]QCI64008.1 peptide-methionine (S)-S-oxide reductase MsrA [Phreatobacter stygius]
MHPSLPKSFSIRVVSGVRRVGFAVALLLAGTGLSLPSSAAAGGRVIPQPVQDEAAGRSATAVAVFAGGCFWGVQGVFQHVEGVSNAVSGYAGGDQATASYDRVVSGRTGHAEAVRISYDPAKISYGRLLQIYFSVAHDPTELDRQGPDVGPQYRSAIFPVNAEQARVAKAYIAQLDQARVFGSAIVTRIEPDRAFYPAEAYHQDFMTRNPRHPYIVINDLPKIADLKRHFPGIYRAVPVLVATAGVSN